MPSTTTILIADDHPLIRRGLRLTIEEDRSLQVVGEAANGDEALTLTKKTGPDVILLDIDMPKRDGLTVARDLAVANVATRIIFLTFHADEELYRTALSLGARGYLLKDSAVQEVVAGIHAVASGRIYISSALASKLLESSGVGAVFREPSLLDRLTATERKIMLSIAAGKTSKEIATDLSIHYRTVENHRTNMCRKLDLDGEGANALLRFALQNKPLL